jgi:hypothetical protein
MEKVTFLSTGGSLLEYERKTRSKVIVPFAGHSLGGLLSVMKNQLQQDTIFLQNSNSQSGAI